MPCFNDSNSCVSEANKLAERRKEEKEKFDARHQCELKPLVIGSTVSFLNSDLKMWSMGRINGRSSDDRSYEILTENALIISRNGVHLCETGAKNFLPKLCKELFTGFLVPGLFGSRLHLLSEVCACFGEW